MAGTPRGPPPAAQVQGELATVDKTREQEQSFARVSFDSKCEAAINEQIKCVGRRAVIPRQRAPAPHSHRTRAAPAAR
jgi:hypothetical protein